MPEEARPQDPEVATREVVWLGLGFLAVVGIASAGLLAYVHVTVRGDSAIPPARFPEPALEHAPSVDRRALEARQEGRLQGYAWVDREHGVARIPIEDAMSLLVSRGDRAWDPPDPGPSANMDAGP